MADRAGDDPHEVPHFNETQKAETHGKPRKPTPAIGLGCVGLVSRSGSSPEFDRVYGPPKRRETLCSFDAERPNFRNRTLEPERMSVGSPQRRRATK